MKKQADNSAPNHHKMRQERDSRGAVAAAKRRAEQDNNNHSRLEHTTYKHGQVWACCVAPLNGMQEATKPVYHWQGSSYNQPRTNKLQLLFPKQEVCEALKPAHFMHTNHPICTSTKKAHTHPKAKEAGGDVKG